MTWHHLGARCRGLALASLLLGCGAPPRPAAARDPIPLAVAAQYFAEATAACARDGGRLWGVALCGPTMLADRATRFVVTNVADARGALHARDGVFVGTLPPDQNIANTAVDWAGVRWTQVAWPLPDDASARGELLLHELFHRIQGTIGLPATSAGADNPQLAERDGRYYLQLEWRALARALTAPNDAARAEAVTDALVFRAARGAPASEDALELNEGLAAYTGSRLGAADPVASALHALAEHPGDRSFVRSFAYATGPAYGLLLDRYRPAWRSALATTRSLARLLAAAIGAHPDPAAASARAAAYDGAALARDEDARAARRTGELAAYRRALVDGPLLSLPLQQFGVQFDPNEVETLGDAGTVYPHLRVTARWGVLEASRGARVTPTWSAVVVPAPPHPTAPRLEGDGWTITLAPGWRVAPGDRAGDLQAVPPP